MDYLVLLETANKVRELQYKMYKKISDETGMHYTSIEIISFLYNNKTIQTAKEICSLLNLKPNLVSFHIDKLVKEEFIIREPIDEDRRKIKLILTEKSVPIAEKCNSIRRKLFDKITSNCSKKERDNFVSFMFKLMTNLKDTSL